jgi:hypothetical protein
MQFNNLPTLELTQTIELARRKGSYSEFSGTETWSAGSIHPSALRKQLVDCRNWIVTVTINLTMKYGIRNYNVPANPAKVQLTTKRFAHRFGKGDLGKA